MNIVKWCFIIKMDFVSFVKKKRKVQVLYFVVMEIFKEVMVICYVNGLFYLLGIGVLFFLNSLIVY